LVACLWLTLTAEERGRIHRRLKGQAPAATDFLATTNHVAIQEWLDSVRGAVAMAQAQGIGQGLAPRPLADWVQVLWDKDRWAREWAEEMAERNGFRERVQAAGMTGEDLLKIPEVAVSVGFMITMVISQTMNGRKPDYGDYRDCQHALVAVGAGAVLVTHDGRLRKSLEAIPGAPLRVISLAELLAIC
jgi:hypothetical protein